MPVLTPSRVAVVVVTLSLLSFLWTFGLPRDLPSPSFPVINHDASRVSQAPASQVSMADDHPYLPPAPETKAPEPPEPTLPPPSESKPEESQQEESGKEVSSQENTSTPSVVPHPTIKANATSVDAGSTPTKSTASAPFCHDVPGAADVMVIVKTSKAEIEKKLPAHLKTLLACVPNFAIFSDHAGEIEGFTVHNALQDIQNSTRNGRKEFDTYEKMLHDPSLKPDSIDKDLDKWKILPMVYKSYKLRPYARFYFFIEADTSMSWTNTLQWVDRLDYRIPYYAGAPITLGSVKFAQRGPGIMLSYGAMKQFAIAYDERYQSEWEPRVGRECCGDMVLATTLTESHVEFYSAFPLLQGETPSSLDWTDRHWCAPMVSWHHMSSDDITSVWQHQTNWTSRNGWEKPYLFRDGFKDLILSNLAEKKDEWDNISSDAKLEAPPKQEAERESHGQDAPRQEDEEKPVDKRDDPDLEKIGEQVKNAADSATSCKDTCKKTKDCLQWKYTTKNRGECHLGKILRFGSKAPKKDDEMWTSGWMMDRINTKIEEWDKDCKEPKWKFNQ